MDEIDKIIAQSAQRKYIYDGTRLRKWIIYSADN